VQRGVVVQAQRPEQKSLRLDQRSPRAS